MTDVSLTWPGHAAIRVDTPGGKRDHVDPWLSNPKCPEPERSVERVGVVALTHGHDDHIGETVDLCKRLSPSIVAIYELANWLAGRGVPRADEGGMARACTSPATPASSATWA